MSNFSRAPGSSEYGKYVSSERPRCAAARPRILQRVQERASLLFFSAKKLKGSQAFCVGLTVRSDDVFMRARNWSVMQRRDLRPIRIRCLIGRECDCCF